MNKIENNFSLAECMPEMRLRSGFTYNACRLFTKNKERIPRLKKQEIHDIFITTNKIKLVFNMAWIKEILKI